MQTKYNKKSENVNINDTSSADRFVVIRNGARVSDDEYSTIELAQPEYNHWNRVITRWPDSSKLEIVNLTKRSVK